MTTQTIIAYLLAIIGALIPFVLLLYDKLMIFRFKTLEDKIDQERKDRKEFNEQIERRIGHSERNLLNQIPYWVKEANKNEK